MAESLDLNPRRRQTAAEPFNVDAKELQGYIDTMPAQYYWVHRRFKTRPEGEPPIY